MQLGVLGPVSLVVDGALVALGGPKQRLVLGLLIAHRGRVVSVDELIDGLWPEGPQAQPRKTVQVYVTRLRRALGAAAEALTSEAAGYRLDPALVPIDADAFESTLQQALAESDDDAAVTELRMALGLWRGNAFVDLRDCEAIAPAAVHLDRLRLTATRELFRREIGLRPHSVLAEIEHAAEANPLNEDFAAQLMTVQYRVGRQADALATYQTLRRRLVDELGVEPGPAVRELHGQIVRQELDAAPAVSIAEPARQRRRVTIVAVRFGLDAPAGEELDAEEEFALLSPLRRAAKARIAGHGGVVVAETGDSLTASFGFPARGDSPVQAVAAALTVRDLANDADKRVRAHIGVETGDAVLEAPVDGGPAALAGITGPPLRDAGLLRDAAQADEVRIGATIGSLVGHEFELQAPVAGDGATAVRRRAAPRERHVDGLLGRADAITAVLDVVEGSSAGVRAVVVGGPPGIGKTAVVDAALSQLDAGWSIVTLYGERVHERGALQPFRPEFPELFEGGGEPSVRQVAEALLRRWGNRRRLLVVDDVDAVDPASFEVLDALADHVADVALVLTTRDSAAISLSGDVVPTVALAPLDRATSRDLARRAADGHHLGIATLNEIADRSGGNPWYVLELVDAALSNSAWADVPTSLYDSLMWRLDRLGGARDLAQRCSILGGSFTRHDIALVAGDLSPATIDEQLQAMIADGILLADGDACRFAHGLVTQIAHESLLHSERIRLHAVMADALDTRGGADPATLAYHLESSGRYRDAAAAWRRASSVAIRRSRNHDAQRHARRSLRIVDEHLDDGTDDPEVAHLRARSLFNLAYGMQATNHGSAELAEIVELARLHGSNPPGTSVPLDMIDISNRHALGEFDGAERVARESLAAFDASPDAVSAAFARQFLAATLVWQGNLAEGLQQLRLAAEFWDRGPGHVDALGARPLAALWGLLGLAGWFEGVSDEAIDDDTSRARDLIPDDDGDGRCLVAATSAVVEQLRGRVGLVRELIDPVWPLAMDLGSEFWLGWAQALLGWAIAADDGAAGRAMIDEVLESRPTPQTMPYFGYLLGTRLGEAGLHSAAIARLEEAGELATRTGEALWLPLLDLERARWLAAAGDARAAAAIDEARGRAEAMGALRLVRQSDALRRDVTRSP